MGLRAGMSQVKSRVRSAALSEERFTAAEIVALTGLKEASVRTEIRRMIGEEYLTVYSLPAKTGQRGRQPVQYWLSSDPKKRAALAKSIHLYDPPEPLVERPTSVHYERAVTALNRAFDVSADSRRRKERERLLSEAEEHLIDARLAEGGERAAPAIKASLDGLNLRILQLSEKPAAVAALVAGKSAVVVQSFKEWQAWLSFWRQAAAPLSQGTTEGRQYAMSALEQNVPTDEPSYAAMASLLKREADRN